jgi:hypothetical protein
MQAKYFSHLYQIEYFKKYEKKPGSGHKNGEALSEKGAQWVMLASS